MDVRTRILIVGDDPDVHTLLHEAIDGDDRDIEVVLDVREGLRRVAASPYDLIITDVNTPELSGIDLLSQIHERRPEAKVLVITGASTPEDIIRAIRERAFAYFSKPLATQAVSETVQRALTTTPAVDDIEVLSAAPHWLGLRLRCKIETGDRLLQFMREMATDLPEGEKDKIAIAFREILMNAIEHGAGSDPNKTVSITYIRTDRSVIYYVRDPGKGFSFEALSHAAVSNPDTSPIQHSHVRQKMGMRPGGFGIFMTRQIMDELIYSEAGNEVLMIKYLN
jgi:CheY-like chemotaxis protein/anti-sigma regulatory factor (Ser/Thr protein kinase)